jgi:two-component system nitrate/nitrite response regulator NarL
MGTAQLKRLQQNKFPRPSYLPNLRRGEDHMRCTRVVIADRHPMILYGLKSVLRAQHDFKIVAHCGDGISCIKAIRNFVPDIAILDSSLPDIAGPQILAIASTENLPTRLVFFTASVEERELRMLAAAGAYAVISKDVGPRILVQILRRVADGRKLLPPPPFDQAIVQEQNTIAEKVRIALTDRERQIMRLVSEGLSNKEIGRRLNIAEGTIKVHLHHIFQKLDIGNRTALAALAIFRNDNADSSRGSHSAGRRSVGKSDRG